MKNIASVNPSASNDFGPWSFVTYGDSIVIYQGSVFYTDEMARLPIEGLNSPLSLEGAYIYLKIDIEDGYPTNATLTNTDEMLPYRTFKDGQKMITSQTSLAAPIFIIKGGPGGYFDGNSGKTIQKCVNTDLMIYANCDGLILLPAPFSVPPWEQAVGSQGEE